MTSTATETSRRAQPALNLDHLLRLRLVVGRYGEMDAAQWWNTRKMLGRTGAQLMSRGFARTFTFAQARVVFTVARTRTTELFDPRGTVTLWKLPAALEDEFDARWGRWLDELDAWASFYERLHGISADESLLDVLAAFDLITAQQAEAVGKLSPSAEGRAVSLGTVFDVSDDLVTRLAAGFALGERGRPAIPYARLEAA